MRQRTAQALLLAALLVAPSGMIGAQQRFETAQFKRQDEKEKEKARQKIGITVQQQKAIEAVFAETEKQEKAIRSRLRSLYHDLQNLYDAYEIDERQARALRDEIATQQQNLLTLYANNENKLRRILNREQFERLRAQMKADRERTRHQHHQEERKEEKKP